MKQLVQKALVYCVQSQQLLVFRHLDYSPLEVGIQVPGGTIKPGEIAEAAALRELHEETGLKGFVIDALLGRSFYDITPTRPEVQERFFFLGRPTSVLPERWLAAENHDGTPPPTRLEFFWLPLRHAHVLQSGQGALIGSLSASSSQQGSEPG